MKEKRRQGFIAYFSGDRLIVKKRNDITKEPKTTIEENRVSVNGGVGRSDALREGSASVVSAGSTPVKPAFAVLGEPASATAARGMPQDSGTAKPAAGGSGGYQTSTEDAVESVTSTGYATPVSRNLRQGNGREAKNKNMQ